MRKLKSSSKSTTFVVTYLASSLLLSQSSWAGIVGIRTSGSSAGGVGKTNSSVTISPGKKQDEKVEIKEGTASVSCKQDPDAATYFPLDFFQNITRDGSSLSFEQRSDNKIMVKFPASIDVCGKFKPQVYQDPESKNVTIMVQLEDGKTYSQYLACLQEKNILADGKIDHDKLEGKNYSEYTYVLDYSFEKAKDIKKSVKLSYGFPKAFTGKDGYNSSFGLDSSIELPSTLCMNAEMIQPQVTYLNKGQDALIEDLKAACKTGDAQRIAEARKSIGNAEALKDIADKLKAELDAGYLVAIKQDVSRISAEMQKIEDRITKEKDSLDESTSKKLTRQYADLAKELDSKFLNPAIYRLDTLMKQRAEMGEEDPRLKSTDEEIKKINEEVSSFSKRSSTAFGSIYSVMEKYAITDTAKTIEDIRLKSYLYGKVYGGATDEKRGKALSFDEANQKQYQGLQKFEKATVDWTDQYLVGKGNQFPIVKVEKERSAAIDRMNKRWNEYQQNEQKNYSKYCSIGMTGGVTNPVQCQAFMSGIEQRRNAELKKRDKDLAFIKGRNEKLSKMGTSYNEYQKRQVANAVSEAEGYESYGASYTSFEDNFQDRFPGYYGPSQSTAYNPSMYNMGGQNMANSMGNFGANNPQMVSPQAQIYPGQFQNQMAWPRLQ